MPLLGRPWGVSATSPARPGQGVVSIVGPRSNNSNVLLTVIAETSRAVAATSARLAKRELLADCLRRAAAEEVAVAVAYLSGELPQRQIGVGHDPVERA